MLWVLIRITSARRIASARQEAILMSTHNMFLRRTDENYPSIITKYPLYLFFWVLAQEEQSHQGLHCLPFQLDILNTLVYGKTMLSRRGGYLMKLKDNFHQFSIKT